MSDVPCRLQKLSFNHSNGRTHSWRFSTFYKILTKQIPNLTTAVSNSRTNTINSIDIIIQRLLLDHRGGRLGGLRWMGARWTRQNLWYVELQWGVNWGRTYTPVLCFFSAVPHTVQYPPRTVTYSAFIRTLLLYLSQHATWWNVSSSTLK